MARPFDAARQHPHSLLSQLTDLLPDVGFQRLWEGVRKVSNCHISAWSSPVMGRSAAISKSWFSSADSGMLALQGTSQELHWTNSLPPLSSQSFLPALTRLSERAFWSPTRRAAQWWLQTSARAANWSTKAKPVCCTKWETQISLPPQSSFFTNGRNWRARWEKPVAS